MVKLIFKIFVNFFVLTVLEILYDSANRNSIDFIILLLIYYSNQFVSISIFKCSCFRL